MPSWISSLLRKQVTTHMTIFQLSQSLITRQFDLEKKEWRLHAIYNINICHTLSHHQKQAQSCGFFLGHANYLLTTEQYKCEYIYCPPYWDTTSGRFCTAARNARHRKEHNLFTCIIVSLSAFLRIVSWCGHMFKALKKASAAGSLICLLFLTGAHFQTGGISTFRLVSDAGPICLLCLYRSRRASAERG